MKEYVVKLKDTITIFEKLRKLDPDDYAKNNLDRIMMWLIKKTVEQSLESFQPFINTLQWDGSNQDLTAIWYWEWELEKAKGDLQFIRWLQETNGWENVWDTQQNASRSLVNFEDIWEDELKRYSIRSQ